MHEEEEVEGGEAGGRHTTRLIVPAAHSISEHAGRERVCVCFLSSSLLLLFFFKLALLSTTEGRVGGGTGSMQMKLQDICMAVNN